MTTMFRACLRERRVSVAVGTCAPNRPIMPNVVLIVIDTLRADHLGAYRAPPGPRGVLQGLLRKHDLTALQAVTKQPPEKIELTRERQNRLKALGYLQ